MKVPLTRLHDGRVVSTPGRRLSGLLARGELLRLWDLMDADEHKQLLLLAETIVLRKNQPVPLGRPPSAVDVAHELERAILTEVEAITRGRVNKRR